MTKATFVELCLLCCTLDANISHTCTLTIKENTWGYLAGMGLAHMEYLGKHSRSLSSSRVSAWCFGQHLGVGLLTHLPDISRKARSLSVWPSERWTLGHLKASLSTQRGPISKSQFFSATEGIWYRFQSEPRGMLHPRTRWAVKLHVREKTGVPEPEDCSPSPNIAGIWRLRLPGLPPARHQAGSQSFLIPLALSSCPCANFNLISLSSSRWGMRTAMLWGKQSLFMFDHPSKAALSPWAHTSKLPWPHICYYFTLLDTHHHKSTWFPFHLN